MRLVSRSLSRRVVLLLVLAGSPAPVFGSPAAATPAALSNIHIDNFGRVTDAYFRGGQPQGHDYADLAAAGIKTVIDLTSDDTEANERAMTEAAGIKYVNIPMTTHVVPTATQIKQFLALVTDPAAQPVYVHCVGGRHRTGVMTAIYRMTADGWSAAQAFAEMKQYKFGADFLHAEFKDFVMAYPSQRTRAAEAQRQ